MGSEEFTEFDPDALYGHGRPVAESTLALSLFAGFKDCNGSSDPNPKACKGWQKARENGTLKINPRDCSSDYVAGIIADGVSMVDIDDRDSANIVLNIVQASAKAGKPPELCIINTDKGIHIYYLEADGSKRKQTDNNIMVLGIGYSHDPKTNEMIGRCDHRIGGKGYACVVSKGKEREVLYESPTGRLGALPVWMNLHPKQDFQSVLNYLPFNHKSEGSRNNSLFSFYNNLLRLRYSVKDARGICKIINTFVFDEPMEDGELEGVLRNDAPVKASDKGSTNIEITADTTADDIFDSLSEAEKKPKKWEKTESFLSANFIYANINDACYVWTAQEGIYKLLTLEVVDELILDSFAGTIKLSDTELKNVKRQLYTDVRKKCPKLKLAEGVVPFADGDYLLETDEFLPFSPDRAVLSRLPHNKPTCEEATQFVLDSLDDWADGDEDTKKLLCEVMGFCLTGQLSSIQQCVLLLGDKQNGKSKFIDLLELIVGTDNCAHLSLKELSERFKSSGLVGKRLNTSDELDGRYIEDTSKFKQLTGQGALTVEKKGKDATPFKYTGVMVFASNEMIHLKDETGAVLRRLVFVNFTHTFEKNRTFEVNMAKAENLEAYLYLALKSARKLWKEGKFTVATKSDPLIEEFKMLADPTGGFLEEITEEDVVGKLVKEVFQKYRSYALDRGYKVMSDKSLGKLVRKKFGVVAEHKWNREIQGTDYKYVRKRWQRP